MAVSFAPIAPGPSVSGNARRSAEVGERGRPRPFPVDAASCEGDDHALARGQAFGTRLGVAEGLPGDDDSIEWLDIAR